MLNPRGASPRRWLLIAAGVVVVLAAWCGWRVHQVYSDLSDARTYADALESSARDQDVADARTALAAVQRHADRAQSGTHGPTWWLLSRVPVLGDDLGAVRAMSDALDRLAADAAPPLVDLLADAEDGGLSPKGGRLPLDAIAAHQGPIARSAAALASSRTEVSDLSGSYLAPIERARTKVLDALDELAPQVSSLSKTLDLLPEALGADGPKRYLLIQQNNAEIRSTGGFPGSVFVLDADGGDIEVVDPVAGNAFPHLTRPVLPLSAGERQLAGVRAGTWFVDAGRLPDYQRVAAIWAAHWKRRFGQSVDGVLSMDPVALSYLMKATGPVKVAGTTLTSDNVVATLLSDTYRRLADPADQDRYFRAVGQATFSSVQRADDVEGVLRELHRGVEEGRVQFASFAPDQRSVLDGTALAGLWHGDPRAIGVFVNDTTGTTGSKLSYYLRYHASVEATGCEGGVSTLRGSLSLALQTPSDPSSLPRYVTGGDPNVPPGDEDLDLMLIAPAGGTLDEVRVDDKPVRVARATYGGAPAVRVHLRVPAGFRGVLTWSMTGLGPGERSEVVVTPSIVPGSGSSQVASAC